MIGVRFDPLVDRFVVLLLASGHRPVAPDLPLAFKLTESEAIDLAQAYADGDGVVKLNVDDTRYVVAALEGERCSCHEIQRADPRRHFKGCPLRVELAPPTEAELSNPGQGKAVAAILEAARLMGRAELVMLARYAARLVPVEAPAPKEDAT